MQSCTKKSYLEVEDILEEVWVEDEEGAEGGQLWAAVFTERGDME